MINDFYSPLQITLYPSRLLRIVSYISILAAISCIVFAQVDNWLRLGLLLTLLHEVWRWHDQQSRVNRWKSLSRDNDGCWWLYKSGNNKLLLQGCQTTYLSPWLVIIRGRAERQAICLLLWRFHYSLNTFRRVSMYLRLVSQVKSSGS